MGNGKTALVTGASAGIGKAFAEQLAKDGFDLVITARRKDRLEALAEEIRRDRGVRVEVISDDLSDPCAPARIMSAVQTRGVSIDLLVNNAGLGIAGRFIETPWDKQAALIQVLVTAVAHLTHACLPGMIERGYGRIIHVSSLAGLAPGSPTSTLYAASKSFLIKFAESLHGELHGSGVYVTALCPGYTYSEFHEVMGTRSKVAKMPTILWQDSTSVARAGIDAVMRGDPVHVPGAVNRVIANFMKHVPESAGLYIMRARAKKLGKT